jgi:hypothetical protein
MAKDGAIKNITEERAARRFHQIAVLERQLQIKASEIASCQDHLKELTKERDGVLGRLRAAARNEGELPLFDLDE